MTPRMPWELINTRAVAIDMFRVSENIPKGWAVVWVGSQSVRFSGVLILFQLCLQSFWIADAQFAWTNIQQERQPIEGEFGQLGVYVKLLSNDLSWIRIKKIQEPLRSLFQLSLFGTWQSQKVENSWYDQDFCLELSWFLLGWLDSGTRGLFPLHLFSLPHFGWIFSFIPLLFPPFIMSNLSGETSAQSSVHRL